jgi:hypothetical protein
MDFGEVLKEGALIALWALGIPLVLLRARDHYGEGRPIGVAINVIYAIGFTAFIVFFGVWIVFRVDLRDYVGIAHRTD